jgi:PKD repeat protein
MKKNITYTDVLEEIRDFFDRHQLVNSYVDGQLYDFQAKENIYSAVVLVPTTSNIMNTQLNLSFDLYFVDRIVEDGTNTKDVYNDELQIVLDFISYFSNRNGKWNLQPDSISLEPFEQKFDDIVAGWRLSVSVLIPFRKNVCEIPLNDVAPVPLPPVADFNVYINGHNVTITNKSMFYDELNWTYDGANVQSLDGDGNLFLLTYPTSGTYTITLTAKNEGFPDSISTKTITII